MSYEIQIFKSSIKVLHSFFIKVHVSSILTNGSWKTLLLLLLKYTPLDALNLWLGHKKHPKYCMTSTFCDPWGIPNQNIWVSYPGFFSISVLFGVPCVLFYVNYRPSKNVFITYVKYSGFLCWLDLHVEKFSKKLSNKKYIPLAS